jgi:tetratricopeptide (TPR) repeat protein
MNHLSKLILAGLAALCLLSASAVAQEQIKRKDGTVLKGLPTAYDSVKQVLSFRTDDGQDLQLALAELDKRSVYAVSSSQVKKDNAKGQLQLANYARDIELFAHSGRHYNYAEKADPSMKAAIDTERARARKLAADFCVKNARAAIAKQDIKEAEKWLTLLVQKLPDEPQAAEAARLLEQHYLKERNARDDELEAKHSDLLQKDLKKGKEHYDRMIERTRDGLTARNSSKAQTLWKGAISDGDVVMDEIDRLAKKYADDASIQEGAVKYRKLTTDQMVDINLHLANDAVMKSSYKEAEKYVNAALALDPKSTEALAQRARIETAKSNLEIGLGVGIGLGWR